ncbi:MAG: peptide deformylase [Rickettsiales bacterium]|jgi:peptide deformylase|nr:peptide deformylase [Rickettsiales bacterium]
MKLEIIKVPNRLLKQKSVDILIVDDEIKKLADDMMETMYSAKGVGLAGVQVGVLKNIIVIDVEQTKGGTEEEKVEMRKPLIFINPVIVWKSQETEKMEEGCLSIPFSRAEIQRHLKIKINYQDLDGLKQELDADGYLAHALQHEIDHTKGICFIDYLSKLKRDLIIDKVKKWDM